MSLIFVLLAILKYIGLALLFLIILLLGLICLLLFCPLIYKAYGRGERLKFTVKWLFGILVFRFDYLEKKPKMDFLIFGRSKKSGVKAKSSEKVRVNNTTVKDDTDIKSIEHEPKSETDTKSTEQKTEPDLTATITKEESTAEKPKSKSIKTRNIKKKKIKKEKNQEKEHQEEENRFTKIINLFKAFINYPNRNIIIKKTLLLFKRLIRPFKPSKFFVNGEVGFSSPDTTGKFLAMESILIGMTGLPINIKGNFEQSCLSLNFLAQGKFSLFSLLWPVVLYVFSKPIWKIIWNFLKNKEEVNEQ